ncbi:MAG: ABC-2 type transport system permease protein [Saprospiraceae bacterium]|jgi:ABC-2 type transport system permease protein
MKKLLLLEYSKWKKNSVIGILLIMFVLMLPLVIFIGKEFDNVPPPLPSSDVFFEFPSMWGYLGYAGSWLAFFCLGLISVFIVVNEVSYKTLRQNIITGMLRKEYFLGKFLSVLVIAISATLYYTIIGLIIGFIHTKGATIGDAFDNSWAIPRFFLMCMGYMTFGLFCGFLFRRSGVSVLFYLIYIMMLEPAVKWLVHFRMFENNSINFYPSNVFEDLMPFPLYHFADLIPKKDLDFDFLLPYGTASMAAVVWIVILAGLAYRGIVSRDV